jgi:hypothetical protein
VSATLYGHFTLMIYRNRSICVDDVASNICQALGHGRVTYTYAADPHSWLAKFSADPWAGAYTRPLFSST